MFSIKSFQFDRKPVILNEMTFLDN